MPPTLAETLPLALARLPEVLADDASKARMQQVAAWLPPIPLGGFELRLGRDNPQVDLFQCIPVDSGMPALLVEHLRAKGLATEAGWERLYRFAREWADEGSLLHGAVKEIWLEFDLAPEEARARPIPSIFLTLNIQEVTAAEAGAAVAAALPLLLDDAAGPMEERLRPCLEACPAPGRVSHVGLMLSRSLNACRVNVQGLGQEQVGPYLSRLGWPGNVGDLAPLLERLYGRSGFVTVCLDVGDRLYPRLGLECATDRLSTRHTSMKPLLDELAAMGLCTPAKREALLAWPGADGPNTAPGPWPGHLMARALLRPADTFGILGRRLSHAKLIYQPGAPLEAKGYIGFVHLWMKDDETDEAQHDLFQMPVRPQGVGTAHGA